MSTTRTMSSTPVTMLNVEHKVVNKETKRAANKAALRKWMVSVCVRNQHNLASNGGPLKSIIRKCAGKGAKKCLASQAKARGHHDPLTVTEPRYAPKIWDNSSDDE